MTLISNSTGTPSTGVLCFCKAHFLEEKMREKGKDPKVIEEWLAETKAEFDASPEDE